MSRVYLREGGDREEFVGLVFDRLEVRNKVKGKKVLVKPNVVSYEPYPTTTHPAMLGACLLLLRDWATDLVVADSPACDVRDRESVMEHHPLRKSCDSLGIPMVDLLSRGIGKVRTRSFDLEVALAAFDCDVIVSLPVLKSHRVCALTGALKNQLGFLSSAEKLRLHWGPDMNDVHKVIAELNEVVKPSLHIVDAVETLTGANELRHGGKVQGLGYMLAGTDPVSLDVLGLELLATVEPGLRGKGPDDILHLSYAHHLGIGEIACEVVEL